MSRNNKINLVVTLLVAQLFPCLIQPLAGQEKSTTEKPVQPIKQLRIDGPDILNHGSNLITVLAKTKKGWRQAKPEDFRLEVTKGSAKIVPDICGLPVNPITISADEDEQLTVITKATVGEAESKKEFSVKKLKAKQTFSIEVDSNSDSHQFTGMGAGAMFYDNQFTIDKKLFDWCFKDVDTEILHILIRPNFEPTNDNDDWQVLDNEAFDWDACQRLFWICWHARQRNPDLKIYACLYSPPAWMKANDDTAGDAGLKEGEQYRLEMAEYVYAFLKHAKWKGTTIDYLCLFNEPDFPHSQDGNYVASLTELAKTHAFVREKVNQLIDADPDFNHKPDYIFPETLGPGSITRAGKQTKELAELTREGLLDDLKAWGVHDYWNSGGNYWKERYRELQKFPGVDDRPIWMTEWAQRYDRGDLASSMEYGQNILNALRQGASAWMAFEWAHPAPNQSGLISTQWGEGFPKKRFWRSKSYYVFRQICNTSPTGGKVLNLKMKIDGKAADHSVEALAIRKDGSLVVHLLNTKNRPLKYDLNITGDDWSKLRAIRRTTPSKNDELTKDVDTGSGKAGEVAAYSLLTLEYSIK